jgi:hypothetical protein
LAILSWSKTQPTLLYCFHYNYFKLKIEHCTSHVFVKKRQTNAAIDRIIKCNKYWIVFLIHQRQAHWILVLQNYWPVRDSSQSFQSEYTLFIMMSFAMQLNLANNDAHTHCVHKGSTIWCNVSFETARETQKKPYSLTRNQFQEAPRCSAAIRAPLNWEPYLRLNAPQRLCWRLMKLPEFWMMKI